MQDRARLEGNRSSGMKRPPAVIVFARASRPGATKTRLIPALGPEGAAKLYRCFLLDTLANVSRLDAKIIVAAAEAADVDSVAEVAGSACPDACMTVQKGQDLGERMAAAIDEALAASHDRVLVLGTDSPSLPPDILGHALDLGIGHDLVVGPCFDGGYYLIGMREARREIFAGIQWSSNTVLSETLTRADQQHLSVALLDPWYDVDTPDDLRLLRLHLAALESASRPVPCPRTWSYLGGLSEAELK
jgi:rSAM/selenodomain-associated transferase 1